MPGSLRHVLVLIVFIRLWAPVIARADAVLVYTGLTSSEWSAQVTQQIDACLLDSLLRTGEFQQVIPLPGGHADPRQAAIDQQGDLLLHGTLTQNGNSIVMNLILERPADGTVLDRVTQTYNSRAALLKDCDARAGRLAQTAQVVQPEPPHRKRHRPQLRTRVKIGQEGVGRGPEVPGGAYLYLDVFTEMDGLVGLGARYGLAILPFDFDSHLISASAMVNIPLRESLASSLGPAYLLSTDYKSPPTQFIGLRMSPLNSGDMDEVSVEVLPFSLFFDLEDGEFLFTLELLSLGVWFPQ